MGLARAINYLFPISTIMLFTEPYKHVNIKQGFAPTVQKRSQMSISIIN